MGNKLGALGALSLGAALMYLLDPDRGHHRRSVMRDQTMHSGHEAARRLRWVVVGTTNRLRGRAASVGYRFRCGKAAEVPDAVLEARVRSRLGRVTSHSGPIEVVADKDRVVLSGTVLAGEAEAILAQVAATRGVRSVADRLRRYESWDEAVVALGERGARPAPALDQVQPKEEAR
jgi:hypothetical protein